MLVDTNNNCSIVARAEVLHGLVKLMFLGVDTA